MSHVARPISEQAPRADLYFILCQIYARTSPPPPPPRVSLNIYLKLCNIYKTAQRASAPESARQGYIMSCFPVFCGRPASGRACVFGVYVMPRVCHTENDRSHAGEQPDDDNSARRQRARASERLLRSHTLRAERRTHTRAQKYAITARYVAWMVFTSYMHSRTTPRWCTADNAYTYRCGQRNDQSSTHARYDLCVVFNMSI